MKDFNIKQPKPKVKSNQKWFERPRDILMNDALIEILQTVVVILLAALIYIITFGVVEGFDFGLLIERGSIIRVLGFYVSLELINRRFSRMAENHARDQEENVKKLEKDLHEETLKIDDEKAIEWCSRYNAEERHVQEKSMRASYKEYLMQLKARFTIKKDFWEMKPHKWHSRKRERKIKRFDRKLEKVTFKIDNIENVQFEVKVTPLELADLKHRGFDSGSDYRPKKKRYTSSASKDISRKVSAKNFLQAILFFGFQGAIIATATTFAETIAYILVMFLTFSMTALSSYSFTYRRVGGAWFVDMTEKLHTLKKMNKECGGDLVSSSQ